MPPFGRFLLFGQHYIIFSDRFPHFLSKTFFSFHRGSPEGAERPENSADTCNDWNTFRRDTVFPKENLIKNFNKKHQYLTYENCLFIKIRTCDIIQIMKKGA